MPYIIHVAVRCCLLLWQMDSVKEADDVEPEVSSDPVTGKQASKPKDIVVFVNLVDFCR